MLRNPQPPRVPPPSEPDEKAIRDLYQQLMDGWNRGDATAFAASFADTGDLVGFDGTHFTGREEIVAFHQPLFATHLKGSRLVGAVAGIKYPGPDVAVFHVRGGTIMAGESVPLPSRDSIQTIVVQKSVVSNRVGPLQKKPSWAWSVISRLIRCVSE